MRIGNGNDWFFSWKSESIGGVDFCEVTKECVLEMEAIGFIIRNLSALA
jgi:hypothetical protein